MGGHQIQHQGTGKLPGEHTQRHPQHPDRPDRHHRHHHQQGTARTTQVQPRLRRQAQRWKPTEHQHDSHDQVEDTGAHQKVHQTGRQRLTGHLVDPAVERALQRDAETDDHHHRHQPPTTDIDLPTDLSQTDRHHGQQGTTQPGGGDPQPAAGTQPHGVKTQPTQRIAAHLGHGENRHSDQRHRVGPGEHENRAEDPTGEHPPRHPCPPHRAQAAPHPRRPQGRDDEHRTTAGVGHRGGPQRGAGGRTQSGIDGGLGCGTGTTDDDQTHRQPCGHRGPLRTCRHENVAAPMRYRGLLPGGMSNH